MRLNGIQKFPARMFLTNPEIVESSRFTDLKRSNKLANRNVWISFGTNAPAWPELNN